jgi:DNA-binding beta-propeller fold protein YncE
MKQLCAGARWWMAALCLWACGAEQDAARSAPETDQGSPGSNDGGGAGAPQCSTANECPVGWHCTQFGRCEPPGQGGEAPPEVEDDRLGAPVSSLRYVYVAMPELDAVARIDGTTLEVSSVAVGERPRTVAAVPGSDDAVVLDAVSGTAVLLRSQGSGVAQHSLPTLPQLNSVAVAPDGRHAVAWFDLARAVAEAGSLGAVTEVGSFQEVTLLGLVAGQERAVNLTVGFRPREIEFDTAGERAFVITDDGISVIELAAQLAAGPAIVPPIPVAAGGDPDDLEVNVLGSGEHAVVRQGGAAQVGVVALSGSARGTLWTVPLPAPATDIDLAPGAARAYAVLRDASALAVIDVPGDAIDPGQMELVDLGGVVAGSLALSTDGGRGILFSNASAVEAVTVIDLVSPGYPRSTHPLQKTVRQVAFHPAGGAALVVHSRAPGDPAAATTIEEFIDRSAGYSIFSLATGFAKLERTDIEPVAAAFAPGAPLAYVALTGGFAGSQDGGHELHGIDLQSGVVQRHLLGTAPQAVGVLPAASAAFVAQRHAAGRVSFVSIPGGQLRTVTGFDLNSRIID